MSISKAQAIYNLRPTARWSYDQTLDVLEWLDAEQTQPTEAEIASEMASGADDTLIMRLRSARNALLVASDWTQTVDAPLTTEQQTAWQAYRQALRDITDTATSLDDVVWPTKPE